MSQNAITPSALSCALFVKPQGGISAEGSYKFVNRHQQVKSKISEYFQKETLGYDNDISHIAPL